MFKPYSICMNPKFDSDGYNAYIFQSISLYSQSIHTSDYENYVDQSKIYPNMEELTQGMLLQLKNRNPQVIICICMYNEPRQALQSTLKGIYENLQKLQASGISSQEIGVFLIQDGILKCDESIFTFYSELDRQSGFSICALKQRVEVIRQEITAGQRVANKIAQNNNFPETIPKRLSLLYQNKYKPSGYYHKPIEMKLFSCFKHLNGTKLSSHAWFFEGFCRYLNPKFCVLLDVGTVPAKDGILNLIRGLRQDQNIGGVSGFMGIDACVSYENETERKNNPLNIRQINLRAPLIQINQVNSSSRNSVSVTLSSRNNQQIIDQQENNQSKIIECMTDWFFSVQKAQQVEYIYAHFFDKNAQSFTKFLHVLPGAWSAYRVSALQTGEKFEKDLLQEKYFKTIIEKKDKQQTQSDYKFANMYLAQDRILSLGIYCQKERQSGYYLKYIPNAKAKTDSMRTHHDLVVQRRRWINSSFFAFSYVLENYEFDFQNSKHGRADYILLKINMILASCSFFNAYFIPCFYLFVLYSTIRNNGWISNEDVNHYLSLFISLLYVATVLICIGGSLNGVDWIKEIYEKNQNGKIRKNMDGIPIKHKKPKNGPAIYISFVMAFFTYLLLFTVTSIVVQVIYNGIKNFPNISNSQILVMMVVVINIGTFFIIIFMHVFTHPVEVYKLILGYPSYIAYQGVYTHTMLIYSFCNVDDVSWGTKGASKSHEKQKDFKRDKIQFLATWMLWNSLLCFTLFFIDFVLPTTSKQYILIVLALYSSFTTTLKVLFAIINHIKFYIFCC